MKFLDNVFIAAYRVYIRYNMNPKLTCSCLMAAIIFGIVFLWLVLFRHIMHIESFNSVGLSFIPFAALAGAAMIYFHYSDVLIASINERFERKTLIERRLWGWLSVALLLIPWITFFVLVKKV